MRNMKLTILIRLGGLAAMASGTAYATLGLVSWLCEPNCPRSLGYNVSLFFVLLALGEIAAIPALYALQRERYGLRFLVTLASLTVAGGVALVHAGMSWLLYTSSSDLSTLILNWLDPDVMGVLIVTGGLVALGIATIAAGVLPWWCGAALIASPIFVLLRPLGGVPLVLVGFAIFRAGARQAEQPSRAVPNRRRGTRSSSS